MLTAVALGFALGVRHAFDPDHLVAVSAITARHRSAWTAAWVGMSWGLGHALTLFAVGGAIIALRVAIPDGLAGALELVVGLVLVALGVANLAAARREGAGTSPGMGPTAPLGTTLARSGLVGLAHGLAGSAPVALLALAAMPTPASMLVYLLVFGGGSLLAMIAFSFLVGLPLVRVGRSPSGQRLITAATGLVSLVFGCFVVFESGSRSVWPALG